MYVSRGRPCRTSLRHPVLVWDVLGVTGHPWDVYKKTRCYVGEVPTLMVSCVFFFFSGAGTFWFWCFSREVLKKEKNNLFVMKLLEFDLSA